MKYLQTFFVALPALVLAGGGTAFAAAPPAVTAFGGKVNFTGEVVATPCAVDNDSTSQVVTLGQVTTGSFKAAGDSSASVPFSIKLIGCDLTTSGSSDDYTKAAITFNGKTVTGNNKALSVSDASGAANSTAGNIGIQIKQDDDIIVVDGSESGSEKPIVSNANELNFSASYVALAAGVTAGVANATTDFTITYQ